MIKIAFLASHNGSAARAITMACKTGDLSAEPIALITNNAGSNALLWAEEMRLKTAIVNAATTPSPDFEIARLLKDNSINLVVCSGYMKLIGPEVIKAVNGAILNVHPALLPKYGGKGMYGRHVHQAVFNAKDKETGITIHMVDDAYDHGRTIAQKTLPVDVTDSVEDIENKVKAAEPDFYIETIRKIISGEIFLNEIKQ